MMKTSIRLCVLLALFWSIEATAQSLSGCKFCEKMPALGDYSECRDWDIVSPYAENYGSYCSVSLKETDPDGHVNQYCAVEGQCFTYTRYEKREGNLVRVVQQRCGKGKIRTTVVQA